MIERNVRTFVFSSSCATYGIPARLPICEDQAQCPVNPYGRSKLMIEQILKDFDQAYGLKSVCLRYFNASGADPECELGERHFPETHLIPRVIHTAMGIQSEMLIYGNDYPTNDGTCVRDYIHVKDLATAHIKALAYLKKNNQSDQFNLGTGKGHSNLEVVNIVSEVSGQAVNLRFVPKRPGDPAVLISDSKKANSVLGWSPEYTELRSIIETAWRWHHRESGRE